jgi:hypothetical protein
VSVITYCILQWNGSERFLKKVNDNLHEIDTDRLQSFGLITNFDSDALWYGVPNAGGSKAYTTVVAAAAFNHIHPDRVIEAVSLAFLDEYIKPQQLWLVATKEEDNPIYKEWRSS